MANVSLQAAADGPSTADLIAGVENGIYIVGDKSWSIDMQRYNFQFTGQRFFRIGPGGSTASYATSPTRPPPRISGARWRPSAAADLRARRRVQLRQGPARPGRPGQPRLPGGPDARGADTQHGRGGVFITAGFPAGNRRAGAAAARSDDCVAIAEELRRQPALGGQHPHHQRRVPLPPAHRHRHRPARIPERRPKTAVGVVSRAGVGPDQIEDVVRGAEHAAAEGTPAEDAGELAGRNNQARSG